MRDGLLRLLRMDVLADAWAVGVFARRAPAQAALLSLAGPGGWLAFAGLYAYLRVWDDVVDTPDRSPERSLPLLVAEVEARRCQAPGVARSALGCALRRRPALQVAFDLMWAALEDDAVRPRSAVPGARLVAQQARIGSAYASALWTCMGERGAVPTELAALAIAATRVHVLRDWDEDLRLGFVNVPLEVCVAEGLDASSPSGPALDRWRRGQAARAAAELEVPPAGGGPRTRRVFSLLAGRYAAMAREIVADSDPSVPRGA